MGGTSRAYVGVITMRFSIDVKGMSCDGCVRRLTKLLEKVQGVHVASVSIGHADVDLSGAATPDDVRAVIRAAGWEPLEPAIA